MKPMIEIPTVNQTGECGDNPCIICGKEVTTSKPWYLHIVFGTSIIDPQQQWTDKASDLGWHSVGVGCLRRFPELKQYAIRGVPNETP